jgi:hypothetical protein
MTHTRHESVQQNPCEYQPKSAFNRPARPRSGSVEACAAARHSVCDYLLESRRLGALSTHLMSHVLLEALETHACGGAPHLLSLVSCLLNMPLVLTHASSINLFLQRNMLRLRHMPP